MPSRTRHKGAPRQHLLEGVLGEWAFARQPRPAQAPWSPDAEPPGLPGVPGPTGPTGLPLDRSPSARRFGVKSPAPPPMGPGGRDAPARREQRQ
jgi:hypothetical protein